MTSRRKAAGKKKPTQKKVKKKAVRKAPATKKKASKKGAKKAPKNRVVARGADIVNINRGVLLSISQIAAEFGVTRETAAKRIDEAGIKPAGMRGGYPVYRLRDVLPAILQNTNGEMDPDKLKPFERRAFYQGELDKLKLQFERGESVPVFEVETGYAMLMKIARRALETLPDVLERDAGLSKQQLTRVDKLCDETLADMHRELMQRVNDADSATENVE